MSAGEDFMLAAAALLAEAANPSVPTDDRATVVTQDTTVSVTNALMAAQVHATLAVAAELAEANEIAAGSNRHGPPPAPPAPPSTPGGKP